MIPEEKKIYLLCSTIELLENEEYFSKSSYVEEKKTIIKCIDKILKDIRLDNFRFNKLINKVESGKLKLMVVSPENAHDGRKKARKTQVLINREVLASLHEYAIDNNCVNCKRKKSKCLLRTALLKSNCPTINEVSSKCQYLMEE